MTTAKVLEINLEDGNPNVETAISRMANGLSTAKGSGRKAVIFIHGYGSTGTGGGIKAGVKVKLRDPRLRGVVRDFCGGEDWAGRKRAFVDACGQLKAFEARVSGNPGVTVVLLK